MRGRSSGKTAPPRYPCFTRVSGGAIIIQVFRLFRYFTNTSDSLRTNREERGKLCIKRIKRIKHKGAGCSGVLHIGLRSYRGYRSRAPAVPAVHGAPWYSLRPVPPVRVQALGAYRHASTRCAPVPCGLWPPTIK